MSATIDRPYGAVQTHDTLVADDRRTALLNRTSWGAIFAGVATALVLQLILNILGVAVGLASVTVDTSSANPDAGNASLIAAVWWLASGILASLAGGVVAGRLCGSSKGSTAGWHGFVSWAATTLVIFWMVTTALGGIVGGTFSALSSTIGSAGRSVASAVSDVVPAAQGSGLDGQVKSLLSSSDGQNAQASVTDYLKAVVSGDQQAADGAKDRAVNAIATSANISPDDARARLDRTVNDAKATAQRAKDQAQKAAEAARKGASQAGLFGTLALVLGGIAATLGGRIGTPRVMLDDARAV